jgi:hypothetical protein
MLYIDQPVQTGFSYDELVPAIFDLNEDGLITPLSPNQPPPSKVNASYGYGTYPSQKFDHTTKTTPQSAKMLWYFAEHWLSSFPGYKTSSNQVSVWVRTSPSPTSTVVLTSDRVIHTVATGFRKQPSRFRKILRPSHHQTIRSSPNVSPLIPWASRTAALMQRQVQ